VKGFPLEEMLSRVKSLLRRKDGKRSNIFRCVDLVLDLSSVKVQRQGVEILLSRKEFGILLELMKRKNQLVTRSDLIEWVWGERDGEVFSNTIDVHIRLLRKKIDDPFEGEDLIQTLRGHGYMIKEN